jgi:hypothetical protein
MIIPSERVNLEDEDYENLLYLAMAAYEHAIIISEFERYVVLTYRNTIYKIILSKEISDIIADHPSITIQVLEVVDLMKLTSSFAVIS